MSGPAARQFAEAYNALTAREGWASICDPSLAFAEPELAAVLAVWRRAAGSKPIPSRADINPRLLKPFLRDAAIYERITGESGTRRFRVRVIGNSFAAVMGNLNGKFLDEAIAPSFLHRWTFALDATLDVATPLRFIARSDTANKSFLVAEYLAAPLLDSASAPNMILVVSHFDGSRKWESVDAETRDKLHLDERLVAI